MHPQFELRSTTWISEPLTNSTSHRLELVTISDRGRVDADGGALRDGEISKFSVTFHKAMAGLTRTSETCNQQTPGRGGIAI
ncbi:hypothetical protein D3C72_1769350 [compost metagenome]